MSAPGGWALPEGGDILADLDAAIEIAEREARGPTRARELPEGLLQLAEAFAARHGFSPPPRSAPELARLATLPPTLQFAIASGIVSEGQARDVDAFGDGLADRVISGELTLAQAGEITSAAAVRDGQAVNRARARNRAERRAEPAQSRRRK